MDYRIYDVMASIIAGVASQTGYDKPGCVLVERDLQLFWSYGFAIVNGEEERIEMSKGAMINEDISMHDMMDAIAL